MHKRYLGLFILVFLALVPSVYADDAVNIFEFPDRLSDALTIPLFASRILASLIFIALFMFPVLLLTKGQNMPISVIFGLGLLGFCVALGWFPIWLFGIVCVTLAFLFGKDVVGIFRVGGGD